MVTRKRWRHERARAFARGAATAAAVQGERAQARSSRVCSSLAPPSITSSCSSSVAVQAGLGQLAPAPRTRELAVTPASRSSPGRAPLLGPLLLALRPPRAQQLAQPAHAHGAYLVALADRQRPVALITTPAHLARPPALDSRASRQASSGTSRPAAIPAPHGCRQGWTTRTAASASSRPPTRQPCRRRTRRRAWQRSPSVPSAPSSSTSCTRASLSLTLAALPPRRASADPVASPNAAACLRTRSTRTHSTGRATARRSRSRPTSSRLDTRSRRSTSSARASSSRPAPPRAR